jgi:hypothetical protein
MRPRNRPARWRAPLHRDQRVAGETGAEPSGANLPGTARGSFASLPQPKRSRGLQVCRLVGILRPSRSGEDGFLDRGQVSKDDVAQAETESVLAGAHAAPGHGRHGRGARARSGLRRTECPGAPRWNRSSGRVPRHGSTGPLLLYGPHGQTGPRSPRYPSSPIQPLWLLLGSAGRAARGDPGSRSPVSPRRDRRAASPCRTGSLSPNRVGRPSLFHRTATNSLRFLFAFACPSCLLA